MLEAMGLLRTMLGEVERRWLDQPCRLLGPATEDEWWGPLRDITGTLRHFRRGYTL
jgi:hypothetical protein